jgi:hypothetical protein
MALASIFLSLPQNPAKARPIMNDTTRDLLPEGLEDRLPQATAAATRITRAIMDVMDAHGYDRVQPPRSSSSSRWPAAWRAFSRAACSASSIRPAFA